MFVQLRRLVCLLLLLQCCLGVRPVKAEEYPTKKDVEVAEKKLNEWIVLADKLLAEGEGCYSEWLDAVYKCGNSSERVKEAAETAKEVGVDKCRTSCGQQQSEVEAKITKIQDAINESKTSLNNRAFITLACFNILGNMKHEAEGVKEEGLRYYFSVIDDAGVSLRTEARVRLLNKSKEKHKRVTTVIGKLSVANKWGQSYANEAAENVRKAEKVIGRLKNISKEECPKSCGEVAAQTAKVERAIGKVESNTVVMGKLNASWKKAAQRIATANREEEERLAKEAAEKERPRMEAEEQAKRKEEEKKRIEEEARRKASEEEKRKAEEEKKRAEEDTARKAAEAEKARRAAEEKERRDEEEKKRVAAEEAGKKAKEEEAEIKKAKEELEKKKEKDGSSSPALSHSPLLLLVLLCVLGCTLVC